MDQFPPFPHETGRRPVSGRQVRVESVGVCGHGPQPGQPVAGLHGYVDVAVDLTPSCEPIHVELAVEQPSGAELVSLTMIDHCCPQLDRRLHLRRPPEPGVHTLHVGLFFQDELIDHVQKRFSFEPPEEQG